MAYFKFENKNVYYKIKGKGTHAVLFIHGNSVSSKMFATILGKYKKQFKIILIDFPGHGKSERVEKFETDFWFYNAKVCKALIDELKIEKLDVIGTSGGALIGINLALEHPDRVKHLIADSFEGDFPLECYVKNIEKDRERDKKKWLAKIIWFLMHGWDWKKVVDADTKVNFDFYKTGKSFYHKSISELTTPTLLTGSRKDEYCEHLDRIYNDLKIKNPKLSVHLFEKGNHPAMISNKDEFAEIAKTFFKS